MLPHMQTIASSMVQQVGYSTEERKLYVRFNGGALYSYDDVPADQFDALLKAESAGKYINASIKPHYTATRIAE